jgi:hypothetical protein
MTRESIIPPRNISFEAVLDETCERLLGKRIHYSISRLAQLETALESMEKELERFLEDFKHEK